MNEHEIERMVLRLQADVSGYTSNLTHARHHTEQTAQAVEFASRRIEGMTFRLNSFGQSALSMMGQLGLMITGIGAAKMSVGLAAETEQMEISFGTMLRSAAAGKQMIGDLIELAAKTPMTLPQLQRGAQTLLQFGVAGADILPTLRMIGDVVGGDEAKFRSLSLAFGQMKSTGRLMGQDLLQMVNAGFNPLQEMSRTTGRSMADLKHDMERGAISVKMVEDAFRSATSAGGSFDGLMEKQSKSFTGLISTMQDDIGAFMRLLGQDLIEGLSLKQLVQGISTAAQQITEWLKSISPEAKASAMKFIGLVAAINGLAMGAMFLEIATRPLVTLFTNVWSLTSGLANGLLGLLNPMNLVRGAMAAISAIFSPVTIVIGLVIGAIGLLIDEVGGLDGLWNNFGKFATDAWTMVKDAALGFWEWIQPIANAMGGVLSAVWDTLKEAASGFWSFVSGIWTAIFGETKVTWGDIQEFIVNVLLHIEHFFRNKAAYFSYWFANIRLGWNETTEWIKDGLVGLMAFFSGLGASIVEIFVATWDKVKGVFTGESVDIAARVGKAFDDAFEGTRIRYGGGVVSPELAQMRREVDAQRNALGQSFSDFAAQRRREMGIVANPAEVQQAGRVAYDQGQKMGENLTRGIKQEVHKLDAVLIGSVEGISRILAYRDMMRGPVAAIAGAASGAGAGAGGAAGAAVPGGTGAAGAARPVVDYRNNIPRPTPVLFQGRPGEDAHDAFLRAFREARLQPNSPFKPAVPPVPATATPAAPPVPAAAPASPAPWQPLLEAVNQVVASLGMRPYPVAIQGSIPLDVSLIASGAPLSVMVDWDRFPAPAPKDDKDGDILTQCRDLLKMILDKDPVVIQGGVF